MSASLQRLRRYATTTDISDGYTCGRAAFAAKTEWRLRKSAYLTTTSSGGWMRQRSRQSRPRVLADIQANIENAE